MGCEPSQDLPTQVIEPAKLEPGQPSPAPVAKSG